MERAPEIQFRNFTPPNGLYSIIEEKIGSLERLYPRLTACRVVVELPHKKHAQGNLFRTIVNIGVPGEELVVNSDENLDHRHEDATVSVNHAFSAAKKRLRAYSKRQHSHGTDRGGARVEKGTAG